MIDVKSHIIEKAFHKCENSLSSVRMPCQPETSSRQFQSCVFANYFDVCMAKKLRNSPEKTPSFGIMGLLRYNILKYTTTTKSQMNIDRSVHWVKCLVDHSSSWDNFSGLLVVSKWQTVTKAWLKLAEWLIPIRHPPLISHEARGIAPIYLFEREEKLRTNNPHSISSHWQKSEAFARVVPPCLPLCFG